MARCPDMDSLVSFPSRAFQSPLLLHLFCSGNCSPHPRLQGLPPLTLVEQPALSTVSLQELLGGLRRGREGASCLRSPSASHTCLGPAQCLPHASLLLLPKCTQGLKLWFTPNLAKAKDSRKQAHDGVAIGNNWTLLFF